MPLPLTISCSSKSRLVFNVPGFPFLVVPNIFQKSSKTVVCVCVCLWMGLFWREAVWTGNRVRIYDCVSELSVMHDAITATEITVSWYPYPAASPDHVVTSYDVQKAIDDRKWRSVGSVAATTPTDRSGRYSYRVEHLVPGTRYRFRVIMNWTSDNKQMPPVAGPPSAWWRTHCGQFHLCYTATTIFIFFYI